ncbi:hypothetical protein [Parasitella parasitica]|uniref:SWI5-dependent HO expression protein 3 n=1 Tax=Parasitella parasitica TaxID=35722 RepID=A0A0B7NQY5_9FUNG|nr:hypothetical protein [Parasitella parasitica]
MLQTHSPRNNFHMLSIPRSASSSSRTSRVFQELQENLESLQKDLENTKGQLHSAKENKGHSERENEEFIESNKKLRSDIQEVMQILESKQQLLDSTKQTYVCTENKVKQLKDEAMAARKELDELKRREHTIEKECRTIRSHMEKQLQHQKTVEQTVAQSQAEFDKEIQGLQLELASVLQNIEDIKAKDIAKEVQDMVKRQAEERELWIKDFENVQKAIEANNQEFIQQVKQELEDLMKHLTTDSEQILETEVVNCKDDVHGLIARIKSNAAVAINE